MTKHKKDAPLSLPTNTLTVLEKRYLKKNHKGKVVETPEQMFRRVAHHIARAEESYTASPEQQQAVEDRFYEMMSQFRFLPNSPTLMNAGNELGQLAACFVLPVEDSLDAIFETVKNAALIHKSGGGTGFSFSRLRAKDCRVGSTGGVASGPVSFMKIFNTSTEQIKQGGTRRGANMAILRVDHPDILDFIHCKSNNKDLNNFNISVGVTDTFIEAARNGDTYSLIDPRNRKKVRELDAAEVYQSIIKQAWQNGDPGIIFLDRINRDNPTPDIGEIESTNPCVTGDTFVMTSEGPRLVRDLLGRSLDLIIHGQPYTTAAEGFFKTGDKPVFRLNTREGYSLRLTGDHKVLRAASVTRNRVATEWCEAGKLTPGDRIILHNHRTCEHWGGPRNASEGYLIGLLVGDGTLKQDKAVLSVWNQAANGDLSPGTETLMNQALTCAEHLPHRSDFRGWQAISGRNEYRMSLGAVKRLALELDMKPGEKTITPELERSSSDFYRGFLSGLFDADGSVQGTREKGVSVRLSQSDLSRLEAVQRMLLRLGIASTVYRNRRSAGETVLPDGKGGVKAYPTQAQHELVISNDNLSEFARRVGFYDETKQSTLENHLSTYKRTPNRERFVATVESVVPDGTETVYDVQVPGINAFDANGLYVHNCGEQPLLPMEACNLGSINLSGFVTRDKSGIPIVDYEALRETVDLSVRFLDNTIDMSRYPLKEITAMVQGNRKIGLGIMGFADLLYQLGIPYDSEEAITLAEKIMAFVQDESKQASCRLGKERGPFSNFNKSIFKKNKDYTLRNATTTTIAPTGTLSILANCSSGIEPLFALSFVRRVMDNNELIEVNPYFESVAKEHGFYTPELMDKIAKMGGIADISDIPEEIRRVFVTAHDVAPEWHIRMQAAFQKHTDNAVSKTVNLPKHATPEDVKAIYDMAFNLGCKGVTIYRDGSKENQVLSFNNTTPQAPNGTPVLGMKDRPETLEGFTTKMATGMGQLYVTVTEYEGRPFEVFATIGKSGKSTTAKTEAIGRLISLALRSGVDVAEIIEQVKGISGEHAVFQKGGPVLSIPDAIGRVLENRYKNHVSQRPQKTQNSLKADICPDCGADLTFEEGCINCHSCGYSKCG